jgi:hypothetical protein
MIKKVDNLNLVPDDIKELLIPSVGEYVPIGNSIYEIYPFPVVKYFELLSFMNKYFVKYNEIFIDNENMNKMEFLSKLATTILNNNMLKEFVDIIFGEVDTIIDDITHDQLLYLLGVVYKLNFLSQSRPIMNMEVRTGTNQMMKTLGLGMLINI